MRHLTRLRLLLSLLSISLAAGCGSSSTDDGPASPPAPYVVRGSAVLEKAAPLASQAAPEISAPLRAALVWFSLPSGYAQCLVAAGVDSIWTDMADNAAATACVARFSPNGNWVTTAQDVALGNELPAPFEIEIDGAPPPRALVSGPAGSLGKAEVFVYEDRNGNGQLDVLPWDAEAAIDRILGVSHSMVYFRTGLPPTFAYELGLSYPGCADFPESFSVASYRPGEGGDYANGTCTVAVEDTVDVTLTMEEVLDQFVCTVPPADFFAWKQAPEQAPPGTLDPGRCMNGGTVLDVTTHPEHLCGFSRDETFTLVGEGFDLTADPPAWWPCEVP